MSLARLSCHHQLVSTIWSSVSWYVSKTLYDSDDTTERKQVEKTRVNKRGFWRRFRSRITCGNKAPVRLESVKRGSEYVNLGLKSK